MKRLSQETVVAMHSELISESGGLDGIRDANMLDRGTGIGRNCRAKGFVDFSCHARYKLSIA